MKPDYKKILPTYFILSLFFCSAVAQNVGIGTPTPQFKLDVNGRMRVKTGTLGSVNTSSGIWFEDYRDGSNVGLHEMAHALAYVNFSVDEGLDPAFRARFYEFSKIARPVFNDIQKNGSVFLGTYATTNYNEFWAVCVENFFERPETFQNQLPELYKGLCVLLNQDPLAKDFIIMPTPG